MLPEPWSIFTPRTLLSFALACLIGFACLALAYKRAGRWDAVWKEEWERRHLKSLATLRQRLQHASILMTAILWILAGAFVLSTAFTWWISDRMEGPDGARMFMFSALPTLALLVAATLCFLVVRLTKYKLERIDELLGRNVPRVQGR